MPDTGKVDSSLAMTVGRATQEGKWTGEHTVITNRYELLHTRSVLSFQNFNRIRTVWARIIVRVRFTRYLLA